MATFSKKPSLIHPEGQKLLNTTECSALVITVLMISQAIVT